MSQRACTVDTGSSGDVYRGALVRWMHVPRGGYGFTVAVDARVVACASRPKTWVRIEVLGKAGRKHVRTVDVANLRWRTP